MSAPARPTREQCITAAGEHLHRAIARRDSCFPDVEAAVALTRPGNEREAERARQAIRRAWGLEPVEAAS